MNKIDGISVIARIEIILKLWDHYSYDVLHKKLTLVEFKLQQDHIILALKHGFRLKPRSTLAIF